jgi:hypothetical protein
MTTNNVWANGLLNALFNAATLANVIENASSSPLTNLYVSLHTADPTASGNQTSSEVAYTSYARVAVARTTAGWPTTTTETISPAAAITFPAGTGGSGTATYAGIGSASSGPGELFYSGPISPSIVCGNGVTPQLTTASTISVS